MRAIQMAVAYVAVLVTTAGQVQAGIVTTTFAGGNGYHGNMFDATVFGNNLVVTGLEIHTAGTGTQDLFVYTKSGSYAGFETTAAAWTLVSTNTFTGNGGGIPTLVDVTDFLLPANSVTGIYVTLDPADTATYLIYTNGTNTYSNSDLQLDLGIGLGGLFGDEGVFSNRTWNGSIQYEPTAVPEPSSIGMFGIGACVAGIGTARRRRREKQQQATA